MRICSACATKTDESGRFCPDCGAQFAELAAAAATTPLPVANEPSAAATSSASRLLGTRIDGQFEIDSIIGGGAFGTVYRGRQVGLDRPVAIKVPTHEIAADPVMARRFAREARSAARVHHPGVVAIHAVGELTDGRPYLAMQFVEGEPLDRILADGPLPAPRALLIARAIASALSETHGADVVHRDLKPSNIMWRRDRNGDDRITLVDFGIAVCKPGNADASRLTSNGLIGTPHYMSPEQAHGEVVDARADLYALGCLLYELVTGAPPFEGSGFEVLLAHLGRPVEPPSARNAAVPECVDELCLALVQKKPDDRPQSADEVVAQIDAALVELDGRASASSLPRRRAQTPSPKRTLATRRDLPDGMIAPRQRRTRRLVLGGVVMIAALAAAGFAMVEWTGKPATATAEEPDEPGDPRVGRFRTLYKDNGEMLVQAMVPDPLVAEQLIRSRLDIKNKLGQPVVAEEIVLTIADDTGAAKGVTAKPRRKTPGRYYFRYTFPKPGRYTLRVFPPSIDSSFEIPIDVE